MAKSNLGYLSALLQATNPPKNKRTGNDDYRNAIGDAVLTFFGQSWAIPFANAVGPTLSDKIMDYGYSVNGLQGEFFSEPIGTLASGRHSSVGDILLANLDPANIFGQNPGGSIGGFLQEQFSPTLNFDTNLLSDIFGW